MAEPITLEVLMKELGKTKEVMRVGDAQDIVRVKNLVGAMGQSFTTTVFAFQQASAIKSNIAFVAKLASNYKEPWVAIVAREILKSPVKTLKKRYAMEDTAALMDKAAEVAATLDSSQLVILCQSLQEYYGFFTRRIRDLLPFYELSVAFEGYKFMTEKAVSPGRGKLQKRME